MLSMFLNPWLLWGLGLAALPVLIHLINLLRHRRISWGAMEFLLASQKKNSRWIKLREWLLLAARVLAVAAVVLMLAQPQWSDRWNLGLGGLRTHHVVVWDDSLSMSDRWGDTSAFDEARRVVVSLAERLGQEATPQRFSLVRLSRAGGVRPAEPDLLAETVTTALVERVGPLVEGFEPTDEALDFAPALAGLPALLGSAAGERRVVYLVSDFRLRQWREPRGLRDQLLALERDGVRLAFVSCVDAERPNLAVTELRPARGIRAAGVPLMLEVSVTNFGDAPASSVTVDLEEDGQRRAAVVLDRIAAGTTETRRFPAYFAAPGEHVVAARLPADCVAGDNAAYVVVDLPAASPALLVDSDPAASEARFVAAALAPGGAIKTGVVPRIELPRALDDEDLSAFEVIYLTNVARLDEPAVRRLEEFVRGGGGLVFFAGPEARVDFYNDVLHRGGQGLFPVPLVAETPLLVNRLEKSADLEVGEHPVFQVFAGQRNSFLQAVNVERYLSAPKGWEPDPTSAVRVLARLRNGAPFAVEQPFGEGRVVAVLSTAAPTWNNWARNPSFVVALLELHAYLARSSARDVSPRPAGSPLEFLLDPARYQPRVLLFRPGAEDDAPLALDAAATPEGLRARFTQTPRAGLYRAQWTTLADEPEFRLMALRTDPAESDLKLVDGAALAGRLPDVKFQWLRAVDFTPRTDVDGGVNLSEWILYGLIALLLAEQWLAYAASYHAGAREARAA